MRPAPCLSREYASILLLADKHRPQVLITSADIDIVLITSPWPEYTTSLTCGSNAFGGDLGTQGGVARWLGVRLLDGWSVIGGVECTLEGAIWYPENPFCRSRPA